MKPAFFVVLWSLMWTCLLAGPVALSAQPVAFSDASALLDFEHQSSAFGGNGLAGAAWFDYDGDGWMDLFLPNGKDQPNALFHNDGGTGFTNVAAQAGVENGAGNAAAIAADFDNDGWPDLFLTGEQGRGAGWFQSPALLYRNTGNGTFVDVTAQSGITGPSAHRAASAADVNNDGLLDLFIGGNTAQALQPNRLYLNQGNFTFVEVGAAAGLDTRESTCATMFSDYNQDGWQDLFMAPCTTETPLRLFHNNGVPAPGLSPTFTERGAQAGFTDDALFMGLCGADYDADGDVDLFVTNYASTRTDLPHALYLNNGSADPTFTDVAFQANVAQHEFGWGCSFTDLDNDGWADLFFTGALDTTCLPGAPRGCPDLETIGDGRGNPGTLLFNNRDAGPNTGPTFSEFSDHLPLDLRDRYTSGVAHADYDQNGFTDLLIVAEHVPAQHGRPSAPGHPILYRNEGNANHGVTLRLQGTTVNRDAIGARVQVEAGGRVQTREVYAGSSHLSTESAWLTFGLGTETQVTRVVVYWPGGGGEAFTEIPVDATTTLVEGTGEALAVAVQPSALPEDEGLWLTVYPNPFAGRATIHLDVPEPVQASLRLYDVFGRWVATLREGPMAAGAYQIRLEADGLAGGVYVYRLQTARHLHTGTMVVLK